MKLQCYLLLIATAVVFLEESANATIEAGNSGNEFYVGFMNNYVRAQFRRIPTLIINRSEVVITTTEPSGAVVMIEREEGTSMAVVRPGQPVTEDLANAKIQSGMDRNRGIKIKAEEMKRISVFALNEELYSADAFTVFPCTRYSSVTSYEYYAASVPSTRGRSHSGNSSFLIVACYNATEIFITPTQTISHPFTPDLTVRAGTTFSVTLNERQTLYVQDRQDLTGSRVVSSNPISFFSGHECGNVPANVSECNHLVEQIPPTVTWGNQFLVAPTATRRANDLVKIISSEIITQINSSCINSTNTEVTAYNSVTIAGAGSFHNIDLPSGSYCYIETNKPVLVVQFTPGGSADGVSGDPFMVIVPAINQYLLNTTFSTLRRLSLSFPIYINVFVSSGSSPFVSSNIILDGEPMIRTTWTAIPCYSNDQACGHTTSTILSNGEHSLWSLNNDTAIGVTVYGLKNRETYAYLGGIKLSLLELASDEMPTSHFVLAGNSLCMPCQSSGSDQTPSRSSVRWTRDDDPISLTSRLALSNDGSLCISNARLTDKGNYTCYMQGKPFPQYVSVIGGIIIEKPTCGSAGQGSQIGIGRATAFIDSSVNSIQVCCRVQGPDDTTVSWFLDGNPLSNNSIGYTFIENGIQFTGPFPDGCVVYTCQANFSVALPDVKQFSKVCFGSNSPPSGINLTGDIVVKEYTSQSYICTSSGFPTPYVMWTMSNGVPPTGAIDYRNGTLSIYSVTESHKVLCCNVGNDHGQDYSCLNLNILIPPEIRKDDISPVIVSVPFGATHDYTENISISIGQNVTIPQAFNLKINCPIVRANPLPSISWFHGNTTIPAQYPQYSVNNEGALVITDITTNRDEGEYTCVADSPNVGQDEYTSTVTITVPPLINTSNILDGPGNCVDLIRQGNPTQRVGEDVCVRAAPNNTLTLVCRIMQGEPIPLIQWLKNGEELLERGTVSSVILSSNITLTLPADASTSSKQEIEGNYSCMATNIAGISIASSYITIFGDIPVEIANTEYMEKQSDLYNQLHQTMSEHFPGVTQGKQHLAFLTTGRVLAYEDYDPGYLYDESEESILPQTMENMFDLVDIIPDGSSIVFNPHRAPRLQHTYSQLVDMLQTTPTSLSPSELQDIRNYLQESVQDLGSFISKSMPRLTLYHQYKNTYYTTAFEVDSLIELKKGSLFDWQFMQWYEQNLHILNNRKQEALTRWNIYGNKDEVEDKLNSLKLTDHSQELYDAKVLLVTNHRDSRFKAQDTYYLVKYDPDTWYRRLKTNMKDSVYQMQFRLSKIKTEIQILEMTNRYLESEYRKREILNTLFPSSDPVFKLFCELDLMSLNLEELVKEVVNMSYACFLSGNPVDCNLYWEMSNYFEDHVLNNFAEFYWYVYTVQAALNHRDFSIPAILSTINDLEAEANHLQTSINIALFELAERQPVDSDDGTDLLSYFHYTSESKMLESDFELPSSIVGRLMWYINPETALLVPGELFHEYNFTINHLNTALTNISAKVSTVNVHRRWFKPGLFKDKHFSLKNSEIKVSPGVRSDLQGILKNETYQLPLYPSALLLATDIELTVDVPYIFHILPTLIKLSYDPHITGGFGPFSFGPLHRANAGNMKFRVEISNNKISIRIPGTQIIGYLCDVVPKHPTQSPSRDRRSANTPANSHSDFNEWLFYKRDNHIPIHRNNYKKENTKPKEQLKEINLISPTIPGHFSEGISDYYRYSTNTSFRHATQNIN